MPQENTNQLILDVRDQIIVITGELLHIEEGQQMNSFSSLLFSNKNEYSYRLTPKTATAVYIDQDGNTYVNEKPNEPYYEFTNFVLKEDEEIEGRTHGKMAGRITKTKQDLLRLLLTDIKHFTDKYFQPNAEIINYISHDRDLLLEKLIMQVYGIALENEVIQIRPQKLLSLDLGTGYYLAMIHSIQGRYELFEKGIQICADGKTKTLRENNCTAKYQSDIYFDPSFDFADVPRLIKEGKIEYIVGTTSLTSPRNENWICIQHYKRHLYKAKNVCLDDRQMKSNMQVKVDESRKTIDLMHIFLVFACHICKGLDEDIDGIRLSVPISATTGHFNFMKKCFEYVFSSKFVEVTTEPEAAFSYLSTNSEELDLIDKYHHVILLDGGDGTFDFLYVKKFGNIWSKQASRAFNNAGTEIFYRFRELFIRYFGDVIINTMNGFKFLEEQYEAFKKATGTQIVSGDFKFEIRLSGNYEFLFDIIVNQIGCDIFTVLYKQQEIKNGYILTNDLEANNYNKKKVIQSIALELNNEYINELITEPIALFINNYKIFYDEVIQRIHERNEEDRRILHLYVGGLASSLTIKDTFERECTRWGENNSFITAENSEVAIIKGIPIQRANISLRDFYETCDKNLYLLCANRVENVHEGSGIRACKKNEELENAEKLYLCQYSNGAVLNATELLFERGRQLLPGYNPTIDKKSIYLNQNMVVMFYKSEYSAPPFFNIHIINDRMIFKQSRKLFHDENIFFKRIRICEKDLTEQERDILETDQIFDMGNGQKEIDIQIRLILDHRRFHPDPVVSIYGIGRGGQAVLLHEIEIWDWYMKPSGDEELYFEVV